MSFRYKNEYKIVPEGTYKIIHKCAGCGCKTLYVSTDNFRVNANGNRLDIWLIYQCENCKHTYNLNIYERVKPESVKDEYQRFLENDPELARYYGNKKELFRVAGAEIDSNSIHYKIISEQSEITQGETAIVIHNPYELKIRTDKILAELFFTSRACVKERIRGGKIETSGNYTGRETVIIIHDLIK